MHARIVCRELFQGIPDVLLIEISNDDFRARLVEHARNAKTDAARSPGDVNGFALHVGNGRRLCHAGIRFRGGSAANNASENAGGARSGHAAQELPTTKRVLVHNHPPEKRRPARRQRGLAS